MLRAKELEEGGNSSARNHAYDKFLGRKRIEKCQFPYGLYF
jgi:hypothetical protein